MYYSQQFFFNNCVSLCVTAYQELIMSNYKTTIPLLFALLVLGSGTLNAQRYNSRQIIRAYPSVGATVSQIRGDELRGFRKWGFSAGVGAIADLSSNNMWHLSIEANYSQRGAFNNTRDPYALFMFTLNYVDIPLTLHFTDPIGGITIGVGPVYSRLVQQPHGVMFYQPGYFEPDTSDMSFLKNDLAAAIDVRIPVWRGLTLNIRYQHSIIPIKRDWHFFGYHYEGDRETSYWQNDCYNSSITLRLLYVFGDNNTYKKKQKKNKR